MHDPDQVRRWVAQAEAEVARLSDEADRVGRQLSEARRRLGLLHEVLAAVTTSPVAIKGVQPESISMRESVLRNAIQILSEVGQPMRIGDIHAEFIRRGFVLPGRGSPTNLVAHLGATDRVRRLSRGVYELPHPPATDESNEGGTAE